MTPEGKVKRRIKDILQSYDVWYFMPRGTVFGQTGVPDFICCVNGRFLAIEAKAEKGRPSAMQKQQIAAIQRHGGAALVFYPGDDEQLINLIRSLQCPTQSKGNPE